MKGWTHHWRLLLVALLGLVAEVARADAFQSLANQRNMLPGGRASLLGGAFTAVADDASASYYNPAGLALLKTRKLEVSATAFRNSSLSYHEAVNEEPFNEKSEVIYPSFVGGTARLGPLNLGYSFMTLDAHAIYQQDKYNDISTTPGAPNTYSRIYQETSNYIWAGVSGAVKLGDHLAIGSSVFYYQRTIQLSSNELVQLNGGGILNVNNTLETLNTGAAAVHGLMWQEPTWSVAAVVKISQALSDRTVMLVDRVEYDPASAATDDSGRSIPTVTSTRFKARALDELNPTTYVLGGAWRPTGWFLLAGDFLVHEGVKSPYKSRGGADLHTTFNYSAGMELNFGPIDLLGGWFTNNSMYRPPNPDYAGQPAYINYTGTTAGLGWDFSGLHGHLGVIRQTGVGEAQIRTDDPTVQRVDAQTSTYVVSGEVPL